MSSMDRARDEGEGLVNALRHRLTGRAASLLEQHPSFAEGAAEIGLVDKSWLDDPTAHPIRTATSLDVVQRYLERSIEKEPSLIASLGLNAIQLLAIENEDHRSDGDTRTTTIVFTDLEGFTQFTSREGDAAARTLLDRHHRAVGGDVIGHAVNVAARVTDSARGGEVLATTDVRSSVGEVPGVAFGRARRRSFKGVAESVSVCPVKRS